MSNIHQTAIVDKSAVIGENVTIGPFAIVESDTRIGNNVTVGANCLVARYTELMDNVKTFHGAVLGTVPQDLKFKDEKTRLVIGENSVVREYAMLNRGTVHSRETVIGKNCLLMAYTHVAHDCYIGDNVILANAVNIAGHVEVGDFVTIGGVVPIHQFVKIGAHSMIGGGYRVPQDICPYSLVGGYPVKVIGLNKIGLKRRGFSNEALHILELVYKILFFSNLNTTQAVEKIKAGVEQTEEVKIILDFIANSTRGITK